DEVSDFTLIHWKHCSYVAPCRTQNRIRDVGVGGSNPLTPTIFSRRSPRLISIRRGFSFVSAVALGLIRVFRLLRVLLVCVRIDVRCSGAIPHEEDTLVRSLRNHFAYQGRSSSRA